MQLGTEFVGIPSHTATGPYAEARVVAVAIASDLYIPPAKQGGSGARCTLGASGRVSSTTLRDAPESRRRPRRHQSHHTTRRTNCL
jgi:hypothetical protein